MFEIGEHIVYGTNGVCLVTDICPSPFDKRDERMYYVLKPISGPVAAVIYTPVDNDRVPMRRLLSAEQIEGLLSRIPSIPPLSIAVEKTRRDTYRAAMSAADPDVYVSLIKTVLDHRAEIAITGRRLPDFEIEYDTLAKRHLYTEISVILGLSMDEMDAYIAKYIEASEV